MDQVNPDPPLQHIFVSYARADSELVDVIVSRLKTDGFSIWIDRGSIHVGEQWGTEIVEAVDKAYAFLLMLSPLAAGSRNVHQEVILAFEGNKTILPVKLEPVEIPKSLRYPLAGLQWTEYYRDPDATYGELVKVLKDHKPGPTQATLTVAFILQGLNRFNFSLDKQSQLLNSIANYTGTPRAEFEITKTLDLGGQIIVKMPAEAAYRLKTAALNSDMRLIHFGIKGLRFTGDRNFVWVKTGDFAPLKLSNLQRRWFLGGSALVIAVSMALISTLRAVSPSLAIATRTNTLTATMMLTPTASLPPTRTPTITFTPTRTASLTPCIPTFTLTTGANLRTGPGTAYRSFSGIPAGDVVEIRGRNADSTWYYIHWQKFDADGWVSSITGQPSCVITGVQVMTPPPLPDVLLETITVPIDESVFISKTTLEMGVIYTIQASGTLFDDEFYWWVDAEYAYADENNSPISPLRDECPGVDIGIGINDEVNDANKSPAWGEFSSDHVYIYYFTGLCL